EQLKLVRFDADLLESLLIQLVCGMNRRRAPGGNQLSQRRFLNDSPQLRFSPAIAPLQPQFMKQNVPDRSRRKGGSKPGKTRGKPPVIVSEGHILQACDVRFESVDGLPEVLNATCPTRGLRYSQNDGLTISNRFHLSHVQVVQSH